MNIKHIIKRIFRKIFLIHDKETFSDGMSRHYYHVKKVLPHITLKQNEFEHMLDDIGITEGDVLIVHSSWRGLYMLDVSPEIVIEILLTKIGKSGTLIMPCFGDDSEIFDVKNTKSVAGVLSEILRKHKGVIRSEFPKFSMCGIGKYAVEILTEHQLSRYQFDEHSPYSIATKRYNAKILLLGMEKNPHKVSVIHCASYDLKDNVSFYNNVYSKQKVATVINGEGKIKKVHYIDRDGKYQNIKFIFKSILKKSPHKTISKLGLNLILFNAIDVYNTAFDFCKRGGRIYK